MNLIGRKAKATNTYGGKKRPWVEVTVAYDMPQYYIVLDAQGELFSVRKGTGKISFLS